MGAQSYSVDWLRGQLTVDRITLMLVALGLIVQVGALGLAGTLHHINESGGDVSPNAPADSEGAIPDRTGSMDYGVQLIGVIVVETLVIVGGMKLYKRLPDRVKKLLKRALTILGAIWLQSMFVSLALMLDALWVAALPAVAGGLWYLSERFDLDWIPHNMVALLLGIVGASMFGVALEPAAAIGVLVIMMVWDIIAVKTNLMQRLLGVAKGVPLYLIIPSGFRIDTDEVDDWLESAGEDDTPDGMAGILGLGDLVFPAILISSASIAFSGVWHPVVLGGMIGVVVGAVTLRNALGGRALPALPWLNTACIIGAGAGAVVAGVPFSDLLGVI